MDGLFDAIAARLRDRCPALAQVETGMSNDAVQVMTLTSDASALVHPISDVADPIRESGFRVAQRETWLFGVTLALVPPGGFAQFEPARAQIKAALCLWLPVGAAMPVQYAGGQVLQYEVTEHGGLWLHLLRFRTTVQNTYEVQS